jgi:hypothetical protein
VATVVLTIAGATKEYEAGSLHISYTANGRATAAFNVLSTDGSYRPAQDATVVITENGTTIFGGLLEEPKECGIVDRKGVAAIRTKVSAADYNVYAERRYVNETLAAGTLKSMLTTLVGEYLDDYGVTLHGSQVDGPTLPAMEFKYLRLDEVLNELGSLTAEDGEPYTWRIDHSKVLRMFQPSTNAAPFNLTGDPITQVISDITVDTSYKHYANRVIVKVPSKMLVEYSATFTGDGSTTVFTVPDGYTILKPYGYVTSGGNFETLTAAGIGDTASWEYDIDAGTVTRTAGAPANGDAIDFKFDADFSGEGIAQDAGEIAAHGIKEIVKLVESVPSDTTAQAIAEGILAKCLTPSKAIKYKTHTAGILPGQSQTVTVSRRNLSGTAVISDVVIRDVGPRILERSVTAYIDGADTNLGRGSRDVVKKWAGDIAGGKMALGPVAEAATPSPIAAGPAPPNHSNQFNDDGAFGGSASWTFDPDTTTVMLGTGHTPNGLDNFMAGRNHTVN